MEESELMSEVISATLPKADAPSETPEATPATAEPEQAKTEPTAESTPADDFYKSQYENLQKDYTRKAQELAELKKTKSEPEPEVPEWTKPDWQPKTWQEAIEAGKQAALREVAPALTEYQQARQQRELYAQTQAAVDKELVEVKALDPKLDENALFNHANKYGFNSLKAAYQNLTDMRGLEKTVQQKVLKNLHARQDDGVGVSGATSVEDDTPTYQEIAGFKSIRSAASAAFRSLKG